MSENKRSLAVSGSPRDVVKMTYAEASLREQASVMRSYIRGREVESRGIDNVCWRV